MHTLNKNSKPWHHGTIAILLSLAVLRIMLALPLVHRYSIDVVNRLLYYPEKPAMELRNIVEFSSNWLLERKSLRERLSALEIANHDMAASLQRAKVQMKLPAAAGYVYARVTLRYPEEWWQEFRINKGSRDGITEGTAVMSDGFLVGRVDSVGADYAWVELITSSSFLIAAAVDETRDLCVLNGDDKGNLKLLYLPEDRKLSRGMRVSTSLMNKQIPPGVPIGTVLAVDKTQDGFTQMRISAGAHLTQLYNVEVFVVKEAAQKQ